MITPSAEPGRSRILRPIALLAPVLAAILLATTGWGADRVPSSATPASDHVGSPLCASCHAPEAAAWARSHHAHAMDHARPETMRGDFSGIVVRSAGRSARFFREGDLYRVETEGKDGRPAPFTVSHSLGWEPLQQYLVTLSDGRIQTLPWAWDTRPKSEGGQRWFLVYGEERILPGDSRHWTRLQQNWNHMCAECHTTGFVKGYDAAADTFRSTFSELGAGCESCHGPGRGHVDWARAGAAPADPRKGFASVAANRSATWSPVPPASPEARLPGDEVETCARCHSRRGQIAPSWHPGRPLADSHDPILLSQGQFEDDGQMKDEVFNDHSFKQSLMYRRGVVCSDCHDPHSGRTKAVGAAVCAQCHLPERFAVKAHTGHEPGPGAPDCIGCHMPSRIYMQVDRRHDHSFRVPRPDLTAEIGTPNTCNACHADRIARWAADAVERWHGPVRKGYQTYAIAFHRSRAGDPEAREMLQRLANDPEVPALARGTAIDELAAWPAQASDAAALRALSDPDPVTRTIAVRRLEGLPIERRRAARPLLTDDIRLVRIAAASLLADAAADMPDEATRLALEAALAEYEAALALDLDRPETRANRAILRLKQGRLAEAEQEYLAAMRLDPSAASIAAQSADLFRRSGREPQAESVLREVLRHAPQAAAARHALGLSLVRQRRLDEALAEFESAVASEPANARYALVHAAALRAAGRPEEALALLKSAFARRPGDADLAIALLNESLRRGDAGEAAGLARRLTALRPDDPRFRGLAARPLR